MRDEVLEKFFKDALAAVRSDTVFYLILLLPEIYKA